MNEVQLFQRMRQGGEEDGKIRTMKF